MPGPRPIAEHRVIDSQPQQEKRAIIVPKLLRVNCCPDVRRKVAGDGLPGVYRGILQNLAAVIVDKLVAKRLAVNRECQGKDDSHTQPERRVPTGGTTQA